MWYHVALIAGLLVGNYFTIAIAHAVTKTHVLAPISWVLFIALGFVGW